MNLRKAIVTGSTKYIQSPLNFPENDVNLMSEVLQKRCKFLASDINKIIHDTNSVDADFLVNLKRICVQIEKQRKNTLDLILFYYSGHGFYKASEEKSFVQISDDECISINEIIEVISSVNAKNKYFIIDACQSGSYSVFVSKNHSLRSLSYNSEGLYFLFGTTKDLLAFEPTTTQAVKSNIHNSFYTHFIAQALNEKSNYTDNTISIKIVDDYATKKTAQYTKFDQIPFTTTRTTGYFPFGFWEEANELSDIEDWKHEQISFQAYSNDQELHLVDYLVDQIHKFYNKEIHFMSPYDNNVMKNLSQPAKDIFNEKLNLKNKKSVNKPLINGLYSCKGNYYFLKYLLENNDIEIDLTLRDENNRTALIEAIESPQESPEYAIEDLFINGYKMQDVDSVYLNDKFAHPSTNPKVLESVTIAMACNELQNSQLIEKLLRKRKIVLTFMSFKYKKVIGYRMNHVALANNLLNHHNDHSLLFFKALNTYNYYDELKVKPSFVRKEKEILEGSPYQDNEYDDLLVKLFPELFTNN